MSGSRTGLDQTAIIEASLAIVDELGVEGLSMRKLGRSLGVDAMAIYGYFDSKAELLSAVVEHVGEQLLAFPGPVPDDPIDILVAVSLHYRDVLLVHPNLTPLAIARPLSHLEVASGAVGGVALLRAIGVPEERLVLAMGTMVRFTFGFILHEALQTGSLGQLGIDRAAHRAGLKAVMDEMGVGDVEREAAVRQGDRGAARHEFEVGIRALLRSFVEEPAD